MPRRPRLFVEGGCYHVYNRASHGVEVFSAEDVGREFVEILSRELIGDGQLVYGWVVMSNHYHVLLRSSAVTLARTFGRVQSSFGRYRNRRLRSRGPTWQSRYQAKLVEDERYLMQLIAYIHLNPVQAGMVDDPAGHELSGHRELLGLADFGLISRDHALSIYGRSENEALQNYRAALGTVSEEGQEWLQAGPGRLPWWGRQIDRPLRPPGPVAWIEADGRPSRELRPKLEAEDFITSACAELGTSFDELRARSRKKDLAELRFLVVGLGIER